jgi:NYN domain
MHEANFELIEIPHVRQSGKNSADIRLVVDALDLCYTKSHVNTFVIISGDSDFSPLVSKLRENAKHVIGVGVKQSTSDLLIANCDEFIFYDDLVREGERQAARREARNNPREGQPQQRRSPEEERRRREEMDARRAKIIEMAVETYEALVTDRDEGGKIWASVLKEALKRRNPGFSESYYGFRTFGNLLEEAQSRGMLEFGRDEKSGAYVFRGQGLVNANVANKADAETSAPLNEGPEPELHADELEATAGAREEGGERLDQSTRGERGSRGERHERGGRNRDRGERSERGGRGRNGPAGPERQAQPARPVDSVQAVAEQLMAEPADEGHAAEDSWYEAVSEDELNIVVPALEQDEADAFNSAERSGLDEDDSEDTSSETRADSGRSTGPRKGRGRRGRGGNKRGGTDGSSPSVSHEVRASATATPAPSPAPAPAPTEPKPTAKPAAKTARKAARKTAEQAQAPTPAPAEAAAPDSPPARKRAPRRSSKPAAE